MLNNVFRVNMPYGIKGNFEKGWYLFNREYLPIGETSRKRIEPNWQKFKFTNSVLDELLDLGCNRMKIVEADEEFFQIFFYDDRTNPVNNPDKKSTLLNWDNYFKILKVIAKVERETFGD